MSVPFSEILKFSHFLPFYRLVTFLQDILGNLFYRRLINFLMVGIESYTLNNDFLQNVFPNYKINLILYLENEKASSNAQKIKFFIKNFFSNVTNPKFPAGLVSFTEEIFNGKLHFLSSVHWWEFPIKNVTVMNKSHDMIPR